MTTEQFTDDAPQEDQPEDAYSFEGDVLYAFETAACMIEDWEYGGTNSRKAYDQQRRAAVEVAKRIRRMATRYHNHHQKK